MTKERKLAIFERGKPVPLLPNSDAEWVDPFNQLLERLNSTNDFEHPLLRSLGAKPSRNALVQVLISIGLDSVLNYHNRVFLDTNNLSKEFVDLLNTPAGQRVAANLLALMDGTSATAEVALNWLPSKTQSDDRNVKIDNSYQNNQNNVEQENDGHHLYDLANLNQNNSHNELKDDTGALPPSNSSSQEQKTKEGRLSPLERARKMSRQSNL